MPVSVVIVTGIATPGRTTTTMISKTTLIRRGNGASNSVFGSRSIGAVDLRVKKGSGTMQKSSPLIVPTSSLCPSGKLSMKGAAHAFRKASPRGRGSDGNRVGPITLPLSSESEGKGSGKGG